jgi:hypothetical protein
MTCGIGTGKVSLHHERQPMASFCLVFEETMNAVGQDRTAHFGKGSVPLAATHPVAAPTFLHKGTNGRWQGVLPKADSTALEAKMLAELGADCAAWMQAGGNI